MLKFVNFYAVRRLKLTVYGIFYSFFVIFNPPKMIYGKLFNRFRYVFSTDAVL